MNLRSNTPKKMHDPIHVLNALDWPTSPTTHPAKRKFQPDFQTISGEDFRKSHRQQSICSGWARQVRFLVYREPPALSLNFSYRSLPTLHFQASLALEPLHTLDTARHSSHAIRTRPRVLAL